MAAHRLVGGRFVALGLALAAAAALDADGARAQAGVKPSDLVTLTASGAVCPGIAVGKVFDQRVNANGTVTPFAVPPKRVLVVTGLDWRQGLPLGSNQTDEIFVYHANTTGGGTLIDSVGRASDGASGANVAVTGVVVAEGLQLCFQVNSGNGGSADAVLHGYLAKDR